MEGTPNTLQYISIITLATLLLPPARDYFQLPRIDPGRFSAETSSAVPKPSQAFTYKLPPLDSYQSQASHSYWPGATESTGVSHTSTAQALNTLPTPPSDSDAYKQPGQAIKSEFPNLATATLQQPGMPSLEHTGAPTTLTQRRPAAINLPQFELPAPLTQQFQQKYSLPQLNAPQNASVGGGNLLTPPSTVPGESVSPLSSVLNGISQISGVSSQYSYAWPSLNTGLTPLMGSASGTTPQPWQTSLNPVRGLFSPSLAGSLPRGDPNSPANGESLPPPPYDLNALPPLPATMSMGGPNSLPALPAHQQAALQGFMGQNQTQTQTPISATTTQTSPISGTEAFSQRPQSTPSAFFSPSQPSSAQQATFPTFNNQSSPIDQSPMSAPPHGNSAKIPPLNGNNAGYPPQAQPNGYDRASYTPYLPTIGGPLQMGGPIMTNLHNPNSQMGLMGMPPHGLPTGPLYHSGTAAQLQQQMFGTPQQPPHNERPFKCDQCPQSFNRNHDLKRHKRIHLAVKPFPCGYCEKSFSRKDALKVCNSTI